MTRPGWSIILGNAFSWTLQLLLMILFHIYRVHPVHLHLFFKCLDKKKSYRLSIPEWFKNDRLSEIHLSQKQSFLTLLASNEREIVSYPLILFFE